MKPSPLGTTLKLFKDILSRRQKYLSKEYQAYGLELAKELKDWKNRSLYIRLAKTVNRRLLDSARYFVKDQLHPRSRARLFMWKLKQLKSPLNKV
jgi:hypothetical protein